MGTGGCEGRRGAKTDEVANLDDVEGTVGEGARIRLCEGSYRCSRPLPPSWRHRAAHPGGEGGTGVAGRLAIVGTPPTLVPTPPLPPPFRRPPRL